MFDSIRQQKQEENHQEMERNQVTKRSMGPSTTVVPS